MKKLSNKIVCFAAYELHLGSRNLLAYLMPDNSVCYVEEIKIIEERFFERRNKQLGCSYNL